MLSTSIVTDEDPRSQNVLHLNLLHLLHDCSTIGTPLLTGCGKNTQNHLMYNTMCVYVHVCVCACVRMYPLQLVMFHNCIILIIY